MDYIRYYFAPIVQILAAIGIIVGGPYVWVGIATLPAFAVIDGVLPRDNRERKIASKALAMVPVWISAIMTIGLYFILAWQIGLGDMSTLEILGGTISASWLATVIGVPSTHELYHQRDRLSSLIGRIGQVGYLDCTRNIAHMIGHHLDVATPEDSDTAQRGQTLYGFAPVAVYRSTKAAWRMESDALEKRGYGRWSIRHQLWFAILVLFVFLGLMYSLGGLTAAVFGLIGIAVARLWVETFNYFQHYGQVRVPGSPIAHRHVWNHLHPLSRMITFDITNHADHHLNAYTPYYRLKPDTSSVKLPSVFVCFMSALIPPVWNKIVIGPALKEWDLQHASAEERKLAKQQNLKAGWPDWFPAES
ncbi:MAG: alkane 1-monooxygenase [Porticoccaceae bacterium]